MCYGVGLGLHTEKRGKRKGNYETHKPHTNAHPPSHQGPGLESKPLAGHGQLGLTGAEGASWQESLLVGDSARMLSKWDPFFSQLGGKRLGNVRKYSLSSISYPDSQTDKTVLGADFSLSPNSWKGWHYQPESLGPLLFLVM